MVFHNVEWLWALWVVVLLAQVWQSMSVAILSERSTDSQLARTLSSHRKSAS